jgi:hypothetical protein
MDILANIKHLLLTGGIDNMIQQFQNPSEEERLYFDMRYVPETDSRIWYNSQFEETILNPQKVSPFKNELEKHCDELIIELKETCNNLLMVQDDRLIEKVLEASDLNFSEVRQRIENLKVLRMYNKQLTAFTIEAEAIYRKFTQAVIKRKRSVTPRAKRTGSVSASFGLQGRTEELKRLYDGLERFGFIETEITPKTKFIGILTANNCFQTEGEIQFTCQTRQAAYIVRRLVGLSSDKNLKVYGESGKFKRKGGKTAISESSIYKEGSKSKSDPLSGREEIDRIFDSI